MPRANASLVAAQATFLVLPKSIQEFTVGKPKLFSATNKEGKPNFGLRYTLKVIGGEHDGKSVTHTLYMHTDATAGINKQFVMAALGYEVGEEGEALFNQEHADDDVTIDTDNNFIAELYKSLEGSRIKAEVDRKTYNNIESNTFTWMPFTQS